MSLTLNILFVGRSDAIVKGSWLIGALISVMSKAANRMTFQEMMNQVRIQCYSIKLFGVRVMVFDATFNNISVISWQSVLLVEESGVP